MVTTDPRVDAYIAKAAPFARPILVHLRSVVHEACPDVVETIKWGSPWFEYKGALCCMAAFKQHCAFGFWKHSLVIEDTSGKAGQAMGSYGRIAQLSDVRPKAKLVRSIEKAMKLNDDGVKAKRDKTPRKKPERMHPEFAAALSRNKKAKATFDGFAPSHKRDYVDWVGEAKGEDTRERRIANSIEWLAAGKRRNWKYERC